MANKEAIGFSTPPCEGVALGKLAPLKEQPAYPSITAYRDGSRDVGCPFLNPSDKTCRAVTLVPREKERFQQELHCVHIFPENIPVEQRGRIKYGVKVSTVDTGIIFEDKIDLGRAVKSWRVEAGLSLRRFGEISNVGYMTIHQLEKGRVLPREGTIQKLADGLGLSAEDPRRQELLAFIRSREALRKNVRESKQQV